MQNNNQNTSKKKYDFCGYLFQNYAFDFKVTSTDGKVEEIVEVWAYSWIIAQEKLSKALGSNFNVNLC